LARAARIFAHHQTGALFRGEEQSLQRLQRFRLFSRSSYQFDASGQEQRVARDNGPGNYDDRTGFVADDGSGQEAARTFGVEHKVTYFLELDFVISVERHEAEHSRSLLGLRDRPNCRRQIHETETDNGATNFEP
jgi:hypothetical protein